MNAVETVLKATRTILVVDWPSRDVPDALARAGFAVIVRGGPGPTDYSKYERDSGAAGEVHVHPIGAAPSQVDLVYAHRPLTELPGLVDDALILGAATIWIQSGLVGPGEKDPTGCWFAEEESQQARATVEAKGLVYLDQPYIADAVRRLSEPK